MRTVITHFFNEEYLLPYWLKHHVGLFDHGVLIDHGSTDNSIDICRQLAPHWRIVRSRLTQFDAYLTDLEVMNYEIELPGWKIALNVTEFLLNPYPMDEVEKSLSAQGLVGVSCTGLLMVDDNPGSVLDPHTPLALQKHWAIDDNALTDIAVRQLIGLDKKCFRNRFYHSLPAGMYLPGRHVTLHPHSGVRLQDLFILYFGYAPWNEEIMARKLQIAQKIPASDIELKFGLNHLKSREEWEADFLLKAQYATTDLTKNRFALQGLNVLRDRY